MPADNDTITSPARPARAGDGVFQFPVLTPTLPPATHTNSYALGSRDVLLIEPSTPYEEEQRAWVEWARSLSAKGQRLVAIALTHHHPDHVGGAQFLAEELGLDLWAHPRTIAALPQLTFTRELNDGDEVVLEGPTPHRIEVLYTPGHAWGHVCYFERERGYVVVGDMVASEGTILVAPGDGDMSLYLEQLDRLRSLGADVALPAHGAPITDPNAHFTHYIGHRLMREKRILRSLPEEAGATLSELVPTAYADAPKSVWWLAEMSLEAHLIKLEKDGAAAHKDGRWVRTASHSE